MRAAESMITTTGMPKKRTSALDRVLKHVSYTDGCWLLTKLIGPNGYGYVGDWDLGHSRLAHRVVYEALVGPIPAGKDLDHRCRRTNCVSPLCLEPVDRAENTARGILRTMPRTAAQVAAQSNLTLGPKARSEAAKLITHCKRGHEFTPDNTRILASGSRTCRECVRARAAARQREAG